MATLIDVSGLTLNDEEATQIGAAILEAEFVNGVLSDNHEIETGVEHNKQIVFVGKMADSLKAASGCTPNAGGGLGFTQKRWVPKMFDARFEHCAADMNSLLKIFRKASKINPDFYDRIDSEEMGLVAARIQMMLRETLPAKVWFSDTAADLHSGSGVFSTGTDLDLWNVIDGLWKQIMAEINSGSDTYYHAIAKNAEASYSAQQLAADEALGILTAVVNKADERLVGDPDAKIYVTRSIADNYRDTLRSKTLGAGFIEITEGGKQVLYFDGYQIEIMYVWDRIIKASQDNGTKYNLPHRVLFTTPSNIPVGTLASEDFEEIDSFYDKKSKANILDVALSLDTKFLEDYMAVAAY